MPEYAGTLLTYLNPDTRRPPTPPTNARYAGDGAGAAQAHRAQLLEGAGHQRLRRDQGDGRQVRPREALRPREARLVAPRARHAAAHRHERRRRGGRRPARRELAAALPRRVRRRLSRRRRVHRAPGGVDRAARGHRSERRVHDPRGRRTHAARVRARDLRRRSRRGARWSTTCTSPSTTSAAASGRSSWSRRPAPCSTVRATGMYLWALEMNTRRPRVLPGDRRRGSRGGAERARGRRTAVAVRYAWPDPAVLVSRGAARPA